MTVMERSDTKQDVMHEVKAFFTRSFSFYSYFETGAATSFMQFTKLLLLKCSLLCLCVVISVQ